MKQENKYKKAIKFIGGMIGSLLIVPGALMTILSSVLFIGCRINNGCVEEVWLYFILIPGWILLLVGIFLIRFYLK